MTRARTIPLALAASLAVGHVQAQSFSDFDWELLGSVYGPVALAGDTMQVSSSDIGDSSLCGMFGPERWVQFTAPVDGRVTFTMQWSSVDGPLFDAPVSVLNGAFVFPPGSEWPAGDYPVVYDVVAGDTVGFGAWSADCLYGSGTTLVDDFTFEPTTWLDAGGAIDARTWIEIAPPGVSANFGKYVEEISDLDGDGVDDLLVLDSVTSIVHAVRTTDGATIATYPVTPGLGTRLARAGDVDADGTEDFIVAKPNFNADSGRVEVISGATGALLFSRGGTTGTNQYGSAVGRVGDVNGDGFDDVAIAAKFGSLVLAGPDGTQITSFQKASGFAPTVDKDFDGLPDILTSRPGSHLMNEVEHRGGVSGLPIDVFPLFGADYGQHRFELVGDLDLDGIDDFAWAVSGGAKADDDQQLFYGGIDTYGQVSIRSGGTPWDEIGRWDGHQWGKIGDALAVGDFDGDGVDDVAYRARADEFGLAYRTVVVRSGATGELRHEFVVPGSGNFGATVANADDVDGDGIDDLAIADDGRVLIVHALDGGPAVLTGSGGPLVASAPFAIDLARATPSTPAWLIVGLDTVDAPLKGGVLVPELLVTVPITTSPTGGASFGATWPAGVPEPTTFWTQVWFPDADADLGWGASNGLGGQTPGG